MTTAMTKVRRELAGEFRNLRPRGGLIHGCATVALHLSLAAGTACLVHASASPSPAAFFPYGASFTSLTLYVLGTIFIGTRMRALGNIMHECVHGSFVRDGTLGDRRVNHWIGKALAILCGTSYGKYRREHLSHHLHLGHPSRDLDLQRRLAFGFLDPGPTFSVAKRVLSWHGMRTLATMACPDVFSRFDSKTDLVVRFLSIGLVLTFLELTGSWREFLWFYLLPYLTSYQALKLISDIADHAGLAAEPDEFFRTRNHILPGRVLNWLLFPRNDEYHLLHHLFPTLPAVYFPECHARALASEAYRARTHHVKLSNSGPRRSR